MIQIGIQSEVLQDILSGRKTVEGRLRKGKFIAIKPGDLISVREDMYKDGLIVSSIEDQAMIEVEEVRTYDSFASMLHEVGYRNVIPSASSVSEAVRQYRVYYSEADEVEYGIVALRFRVVPSPVI